jgi:hypothetical protein
MTTARGTIGHSPHTETAMRTACLLLLVLSTAAFADDKPLKWEYAELTYRATAARPAGKDKDGNEGAAAPSGMAIRWTAGTDDLSVKGWDELAEKLKAPLKKESSPASQKIQVLNALGGAGWELVSQQATTPAVAAGGMGGPGGAAGAFGGGIARAGATTMLFKRRVP